MVSFDEKRPLLVCAGDEDVSTQGERRGAMTRAQRATGDLVVDLTQLTFADASLMFDLAMVAGRLRKRGRRLLLRGAQPHIQRLIELVGLDRQPGVAPA